MRWLRPRNSSSCSESVCRWESSSASSRRTSASRSATRESSFSCCAMTSACKRFSDRGRPDQATEARESMDRSMPSKSMRNHLQKPHEYRGIMLRHSDGNSPAVQVLRGRFANRCLPSKHRQAARGVRRTVPLSSLRPDEAASLQSLGRTGTDRRRRTRDSFTMSPRRPAETRRRVRRMAVRCSTVCTWRTRVHRSRGACRSPRQPIQIFVPVRKFDHLRRLSRIERNSAASAPLSTLIAARPGSSIWIEPEVLGLLARRQAALQARSRGGSRDGTPSQAADAARGLGQLAAFEMHATPLENLVGVQTMRPGTSAPRSRLARSLAPRSDASPIPIATCAPDDPDLNPLCVPCGECSALERD